MITRGAQGLGKSTLIRGLGLDSFTLCPDDLRGLWGSPVITHGGRWEVNHQHEASVWGFLGERLSERMSRGELVLVDATHTYIPGLQGYLELMERYGYRGLCVDFSRAPLEEALAGNQRRPWRKRVPDEAVRRVWRVTQAPLPEEITRGFEWLYWRGAGSLEEARSWLRSEERSLGALDPKVLFGVSDVTAESLSVEALHDVLELDDQRPTVWMSPLLSLLSPAERHQMELNQLEGARLESIGSQLKALCARAPQLTLLRGPLEASDPSWCASIFEDAARWLSAERCLDVHWAPLALPPPSLVCVSSSQLTEREASWPAPAQTGRPLHELNPGEWASERAGALGLQRDRDITPPRWASITRASFPETLSELSSRDFKPLKS